MRVLLADLMMVRAIRGGPEVAHLRLVETAAGVRR